MSDDFGTVSSRKGERAREIARLREHYRNHRETLSGLAGDAPSDHLATEYERLVGEIDNAVRKLDELEGKSAATSVPPPTPADTNPMIRPATRPGATAPGSRPLVRPAEPETVVGRTPGITIAMIIVAGLLVIGAIAYLVWHPRSNPKPTVVEQPVSTSTVPAVSTAPPTITPATPPAAAASLKISPALADYGVVRKGTRAVRQFEVVNESGGPIELQVARSTCRCLFYDYKSKLAPNGKETITVTVDGARAKQGTLQEQVDVSAKGNPGVAASFTVQATIK